MTSDRAQARCLNALSRRDDEMWRARARDRRAATAGSRSAVERGVLDHPSHQLIERDPRMRRELGHERRLGHAGLSVDFETDESPGPLDALVVAEIRTAHAPAAQRA